MGVSLGSVTRAYAALEQRGLIRGEGRRGTFVRASPEDALGALATEPGAVDLGRNVPPAEGDPSIQAALRGIANGSPGRLLRYPPTAGWRDHREVGAEWLNAQGIPAESGDVVVTSGAQHGILIVLSALLSAGDVLYVGEVTYPGVLAAAASLGIQVKSVPMDEGGIVPSALAELCQKQPGRALYCIPTLQNPTTAVLSAERKHAIVEIARGSGLWLIEDEIHRMLVRRAPPSFYELWPERAFLISSVSKVVAGGLRVGFLLGPERHRLLAAVNATIFGGTGLAADVFAKLWADGHRDAGGGSPPKRGGSSTAACAQDAHERPGDAARTSESPPVARTARTVDGGGSRPGRDATKCEPCSGAGVRSGPVPRPKCGAAELGGTRVSGGAQERTFDLGLGAFGSARRMGPLVDLGQGGGGGGIKGPESPASARGTPPSSGGSMQGRLN